MSQYLICMLVSVHTHRKPDCTWVDLLWVTCSITRKHTRSTCNSNTVRHNITVYNVQLTWAGSFQHNNYVVMKSVQNKQCNVNHKNSSAPACKWWLYNPTALRLVISTVNMPTRPYLRAANRVCSPLDKLRWQPRKVMPSVVAYHTGSVTGPVSEKISRTTGRRIRATRLSDQPVSLGLWEEAAGWGFCCSTGDRARKRKRGRSYTM